MSALEGKADMFHSPELGDAAALNFRLICRWLTRFRGQRGLGLAVGVSGAFGSRILKKISRPHGLDQRRSLPTSGVATLPLPPCGRLPSPREHGGRLRALDPPTPVGPAPFFFDVGFLNQSACRRSGPYKEFFVSLSHLGAHSIDSQEGYLAGRAGGAD